MYRIDGSLDKYKARLVAMGYTQTYEVDYSEIFALQSNMDSIATIIALAAHYGWDLQQYDVKNAFLHGNLEEEIYKVAKRRFL